MELNKTYFYTASILGWRHLLKSEDYKNIMIDSLRYLSSKELVIVYGFAIMPNHFHIIWKMIKYNGKEMPHTSFMKFTSHQFQKILRNENAYVHEFYGINCKSRKYMFWQRDSLPFELYSQKVFKQKLNYIHQNPLQKRWKLVDSPAEYIYSSAKFYEKDIDDFGFIKDYRLGWKEN